MNINTIRQLNPIKKHVFLSGKWKFLVRRPRSKISPDPETHSKYAMMTSKITYIPAVYDSSFRRKKFHIISKRILRRRQKKSRIICHVGQCLSKVCGNGAWKSGCTDATNPFSLKPRAWTLHIISLLGSFLSDAVTFWSIHRPLHFVNLSLMNLKSTLNED